MTERVPRKPRPPAGGRLWRRALALAAARLASALAGCASIEAPSDAGHCRAGRRRRNPGRPPRSVERKRLIEAFGGEYHAPGAETLSQWSAGKARAGVGRARRALSRDHCSIRRSSTPSPCLRATSSSRAGCSRSPRTHRRSPPSWRTRSPTSPPVTRRSAPNSRRPRRCSRASIQQVLAQRAGRRRGGGAVETVDRQLFAPAGVRGRPDRHQGHRQGGLRSLWRVALPHCARRVERASRVDIGAGTADRPDMMATHPVDARAYRSGDTPKRGNSAGPGVGATGRDAYLAAIDGMAFGDDPSQGVVRGTTFIHPKLGFAFEAPEGFTLENQTAALIGVGQAGGEALRLDSVAIAEFDAGRQRDRLRLDRRRQDEPRSSRCRSADWTPATAVAQGEQWSFRLGAVRLNGRLYRLIFAAHTLSPAIDARFRASLQSFSSDQRAGFGGRGGSDDQGRRRGQRRHLGRDGGADGVPAAAARPVSHPQRARARAFRSSPVNGTRSSAE